MGGCPLLTSDTRPYLLSPPRPAVVRKGTCCLLQAASPGEGGSPYGWAGPSGSQTRHLLGGRAGVLLKHPLVFRGAEHAEWALWWLLSSLVP